MRKAERSVKLSLTKVKQFFQDETHQRVLNEMKNMLREKPLHTMRDVCTVLSEAKSFESHSIIGNTVFNELGLHRFRVQTSADLAKQRREHLAQFLQADDLAQFQQNGFILKENFLPDDEFAQLKQELCNTALETRETLQGDTVTRRMALDHAALKHLPMTKALLNRPDWQHLINYVGSFKVQPMYYVQVILSHVRKARPDPQTNLHSDTFHPSVKAWLFLNDVAEDQGPFVYVPGSHKVNAARLAWEHQKACSMTPKSPTMTRRGSFRVNVDELATMGYAQPKAFAVKANTLVIADTYGFHARGKSVGESMRIELWAYARRNPFLPWVGWNPLSLPIVNQRLVPLYWKSLDMLEQKYQRNNPWKKVGKRIATEAAVIKQK